MFEDFVNDLFNCFRLIDKSFNSSYLNIGYFVINPYKCFIIIAVFINYYINNSITI